MSLPNNFNTVHPDILETIHSDKYRFLDTDEHLGNHIMLLGICETEDEGMLPDNDDPVIRGVTLQTKRDILGLTFFNKMESANTNTVIYSLNRFAEMLMNGNPDAYEILGITQENTIFINAFGRIAKDYSESFLSKRLYSGFDAKIKELKKRCESAKSENEVNYLAAKIIFIYMLGINIVETKRVSTKMNDETRELITNIHKGKLTRDGHLIDRFWNMERLCHQTLKETIEKSDLPDTPNFSDINDFVCDINERVVKGEYPFGARN